MSDQRAVEFVDCTCGHASASHDAEGCFPACGCSRPGPAQAADDTTGSVELARPILLDVCCCQGGASRGYERAGYQPFGIDLHPQPRYPYPFHQGDAIDALLMLAAGRGVLFTRPDGTKVELFNEQIAAKHGSPPCQAYTLCQRLQGNDHPDLVDPIRTLFSAGPSPQPWVIENVEGAPLRNPVLLCGAMFNLRTYRHRLFESSFRLVEMAHPEHVARTTKMGRPPQPGEFMHVVGNFSGVAQAREVMDMPWANRDGLREAIPPVYSEWVGAQFRYAKLEAMALSLPPATELDR